VHGDLYARHVLLDESARACGVIDWGDTHVGEPALDLAIAWMLLPAEARPAFSGAYGGIDDDAWKRARFRAVYHQANTVLYADEVGDEALRRACLASLRHAGRP
jgi:aminoglycoside phosphotransferase (APT) family kinase protein